MAWLLPLLACCASATAADVASATVPMVGCSTDEQSGPAKPPALQSISVALDPRSAAQIAYYSASHASGVYAPRGWSCVAWDGLTGSILVVAPKRIPPPYFPLPVIAGPAVVMQSSDAASSGRFRVAVVAAQLFPLPGAEFITRIRQEHLIPDSSFDPEQYPDEQLQYLSDRFVEFMTPPNASGLGTDGMFEPSNLAVRGLIILNLPDEVNSLTEFRLRLAAGMDGVAAAIIQLETSCIQQHGRCRGTQ